MSSFVDANMARHGKTVIRFKKSFKFQRSGAPIADIAKLLNINRSMAGKIEDRLNDKKCESKPKRDSHNFWMPVDNGTF